jgi:hypothetical protein
MWEIEICIHQCDAHQRDRPGDACNVSKSKPFCLIQTLWKRESWQTLSWVGHITDGVTLSKQQGSGKGHHDDELIYTPVVV